MARLSVLQSQALYADGKAVAFHEECRALMARLMVCPAACFYISY